MKIGWATCWILVQVILLCGCGEKSEVESEGRTSAGTAQTAAVSNEVEKTIAEIEKDFALSLPYAATNWSGCAAVAHGTVEKILKLPPALREPYGRKMAQAILSVPIDHLPYYDRSRTLYMMWEMVGETGRLQIGWKCVWELRIMRLRHLREAIEHARKEKNDWYNRSYITTVSNNLNGYSGCRKESALQETSVKAVDAGEVHRIVHNVTSPRQGYLSPTPSVKS